MLRAIREIQPLYVLGENVGGIISWDAGVVFEQVQVDLENEGYEIIPFILPACSVNAPHRRDRVWFVAHRKNTGLPQSTTINQRGKCFAIHRNEIWGSFGAIGTVEASTDSDKCAKGPSRTSGRITGKGSNNNDEQKERGEQTEQHIGCSDVLRDATNTTSKQGKWMRSKFGESCLQEQGEFRRSDCDNGSGGIAANPSNQGLEGSEVNGSVGGIWTERKQQSFRSLPPTWANFPTQSPIRSRNDGVSTRLDGITFSKWRNESIKAAGNAIVPQVALQIFKAIENTIKS
jgi:DNA (cytosine-5)-methyltransferase 1